MTLEYLNNRDAILDILEEDKVAALGRAMQWAHDTNDAALTELWTALFDNAQCIGNSMKHSNGVSRATLIRLNEWIEAKKRKVAA